jgi:hypothetical protein
MSEISQPIIPVMNAAKSHFQYCLSEYFFFSSKPSQAVNGRIKIMYAIA